MVFYVEPEARDARASAARAPRPLSDDVPAPPYTPVAGSAG